MGLIGFLILGLIAGAIAKALHRGDEPGGFLGTLAVGVLGAVLGGLIASAIGLGGLSSFFSLGTWLTAIGRNYRPPVRARSCWACRAGHGA